MDELEIRFTKEAIENARRVEKCGLPRRSRWISMIAQHGSAKGAWQSQSDGYSDGFADLCIAGLHELTAEHLILQRRFASLFSSQERELAYDLLRKFCGDRFTEQLDGDGYLPERGAPTASQS